jgi:hypothetical protein
MRHDLADGLPYSAGGIGVIPVSSQRIYRVSAAPQIGASLRIGDQLYTITDIEAKMTRSGRRATILTLRSVCTVCGAPFCFEATKSRISPIRTCRKHRKHLQKQAERPKPATKLTRMEPRPPVLRPPIPKVGEQLSFNGENCTVTKLLVGYRVEVDYADGTYEEVDCRRLRRPR